MKIQVIACFLLIGVTVHYGKLSEKKNYSYRSTNIIVLANRCQFIQLRTRGNIVKNRAYFLAVHG